MVVCIPGGASGLSTRYVHNITSFCPLTTALAAAVYMGAKPLLLIPDKAYLQIPLARAFLAPIACEARAPRVASTLAPSAHASHAFGARKGPAGRIFQGKSTSFSALITAVLSSSCNQATLWHEPFDAGDRSVQTLSRKFLTRFYDRIVAVLGCNEPCQHEWTGLF